ncbi:MAG TPA: hypothetical protein VNL38_04025 [Candidatus Nitrosotenuis sp.]|nr:hypothetical protein [Candidatus Nitrosotenuis sp.]
MPPVRTKDPRAPQENAAAQPVNSGEQWLGRNASDKRRLWEQLNPRHRKQLQLLARAQVLHQQQGRLTEGERARLSRLLNEIELQIARLETLLGNLAAKSHI